MRGGMGWVGRAMEDGACAYMSGVNTLHIPLDSPLSSSPVFRRRSDTRVCRAHVPIRGRACSAMLCGMLRTVWISVADARVVLWTMVYMTSLRVLLNIHELASWILTVRSRTLKRDTHG